MAKFIISGGNKLQGRIEVLGAKNAAMKIMAAALLTDEVSILENVPDILDIETMKGILESLNVKVTRFNHTLTIDPTKIASKMPNPDLVTKMRGSVVLIGPLLARFGQVKFAQPGGCVIGARPIDTHLDALAQIGVTIEEKVGFFNFKADKLLAKKIVLKEKSVTTTENVMMAAVLNEGKTIIQNAAQEPEIEDLANFLHKMGAKISGAGTNTIEIVGVKKLKGAKHQVIADRIEAGTFALAAAVTNGELEILNFNPGHLQAFIQKMQQAGVKFQLKSSSIHILPSLAFEPVDIKTGPYPAFPTDLQAPFSVLLTQAVGKSTIYETMYEGRLRYLAELNMMGAKAKLINHHQAEIFGPTKLSGKKIKTLDLRAGATLILAALIAKGQTEISDINLIDRGYERIDERLQKLGAKISRVN
ncbi:MAG: UDP-N-acetylglucosamine 1-carboxyvinyltransferase [Candidatus Nealsonbacteria bacterium CG23_combo_of_CG06-09_8_20_14_all_40_13]|uniref:UDP-N-acetylglucosamine 1-carboxyvinyltransferase n=1 Tax=Candidatus Nealsonbacteria bacterium CG23_combo_of_CG06-09_8_20_14_all_40_13 TaxID=1974724 RepID=A0A2G9YR80_9BACT|nr:MAG: UDP-N-acetylglucosamine 1-carboxyvinyltransferase [Candidatus Nealsonbacteria bacterium CG23_combo_of_CG06-09_8_20_14_all_40_13]PIR71005.1 MAG: UDP-N-acetylglucosamine 1-carboxyvinyltransferase [Candidatus Nealsonbacteria bacterium CG10_big_fil_rev_8_21_14_0_10_40_24]PIU43380.1 MAG: UDP-N-acetylglucosamine 1-carboxyvinyltransferase [Candidatus Nealsonbacteria bacterium CG07_land_8_20_14_0_80_40_10]